MEDCFLSKVEQLRHIVHLFSRTLEEEAAAFGIYCTCPIYIVQWNPSIRTPLNKDTSLNRTLSSSSSTMFVYFPNEDTSLIRTLSSSPIESGLEGFHCACYTRIFDPSREIPPGINTFAMLYSHVYTYTCTSSPVSTSVN